MPKLRLNQDPGDVAFDVGHGTTTIGRDEGNDIRLDDCSVSARHCVLQLGSDGLRVRDLDSSNGTYIDGWKIEEAALRPGQVLKLGEVELILEAPAIKVRVRSAGTATRVHPPTVIPGANVAVPSKALEEDFGDGERDADGADPSGSMTCGRCRHTFTEMEAKRTRIGFNTLYSCPHCGAQHGCVREPIQAAAVAPSSGMFRTLLGAFQFPLSSDGLMLLIAGTLFFSFLHAARFISQFAGLLGLISVVFITVFLTGYLMSFMKAVVASSSAGEDHIPKWPDLSDIGGDIVGPFLQVLGLITVCFAPGLAWLIFGPEAIRVPVGVGFLLLGLFYLPMSFLAVSLSDTLTSLNPMIIIPAIVRIQGQYLLVLLFIAVALCIRFGVLTLVDYVPIPILPFVIAEFISLYFLVVIMRVLGLMYYVNRNKLGWT